MSAPKSVAKTKFRKGQAFVQYEDFSDQANYYLHELTRAGLKDVGRFLRKKWKEIYYQNFKKHTGKGGANNNYVVYSKKDEPNPRIRIGIRGGKVDGFYAYFQEFGTSRTPKKGLLRKSVVDNIAEIVKIESQYLSGLSGLAESLNNQISEEEYTEND